MTQTQHTRVILLTPRYIPARCSPLSAAIVQLWSPGRPPQSNTATSADNCTEFTNLYLSRVLAQLLPAQALELIIRCSNHASTRPIASANFARTAKPAGAFNVRYTQQTTMFFSAPSTVSLCVRGVSVTRSDLVFADGH
jgi:hypothetical protein